MSLAQTMVSDISSVFLNTDEMAQTVVLISPEGVTRTITAVVESEPARVERRIGHRVRIESFDVAGLDTDTSLGDVGEGWGAELDADTSKPRFDFASIREQEGGFKACLFERTTILDTGLPEPADI